MRTFAFAIIVTFFSACSPDNITPTTPVPTNLQPDLSTSSPVRTGMFVGSGGHSASGTVSVYEKDGKKIIVFDPYSSQSGPDLKVYLSKNESASEYIRVGPLMSTTGKQSYEIPGNPNLAEYPFVHIWCEQFSVEFARAALK